MRRVTFFLDGQPQGKQRSRSTKSGRHYTPKTTVDYERWIREAYINQTDGLNYEPLETPVVLSIIAYREIPKATSEKKRKSMVYCTTKPDWDNIGKVVSDALNGIAWKDDSQIVQGKVIKNWAEHGYIYIDILEQVE